MTITAEIIADSNSPDGARLTTILTTAPRYIHAEMLRHRIFSSSVSSSRAIPVKKLVAGFDVDPVFPTRWGKNQPGMQAREEVTDDVREKALTIWMKASRAARDAALALEALGVAKEISNRLIEPYIHVRHLITATEWNGFFALRDHPDAQPEIQELARAMKAAMNASTPELLYPGEWHLPFIYDDKHLEPIVLRKMSAARCARVSYLTHDNRKPSVDEDLALFDRLVKADPPHASPTEHQATPDVATRGGWDEPKLHGNFVGFIQFRKLLGI